MILLPASVEAHMLEEARRGYPNEICGVLLGTPGEPRTVAVAHAARNLNTERARDRYLLDPQDFLAADRRARAIGVEVIGFYHSHPDHPARPSETDRQHAAPWPGYSHIVISVVGGTDCMLKSFVLVEESQQFVEEEVRVIPSAGTAA